jgi:flagellar biogenesis protein FliO
MEQALGVIAVLCLLGLTLWLLRAKGLARFRSAGRKTGVLTAVDRLPLGPQHALHLVRVGDRAVLVAVSPAGCSVLESMPWQTIEEARRQAGGGPA